MVDQSSLKTAIWTVKLAFLLIGLISTVLLLKIAIPYSLSFLLSALPRIWISFRRLLSPPYLYIVVNFIIITIAASSSYHQKKSEKKTEARVDEEKIQKKQRDLEASAHQNTASEIWPEISSLIDSGKKPSDSDDGMSDSASCLTYSQNLTVSSRIAVKESVTPLTENKRKSNVRSSLLEKASSSSNPLGVSKQKKHETLDATWKVITDGRGKPLTRRLKKSDTWDTPPSVEAEPQTSARRELRKSDTFNDAASSASSSGSSSSSRRGGLRRETSLSQDELNRRVEAFIKKFNDEIRLERQESYKHYMDMVNRGYH